MGLLLNGAGIETSPVCTHISYLWCMGLLLNGAGIETFPLFYLEDMSNKSTYGPAP